MKQKVDGNLRAGRLQLCLEAAGQAVLAIEAWAPMGRDGSRASKWNATAAAVTVRLVYARDVRGAVVHTGTDVVTVLHSSRV